MLSPEKTQYKIQGMKATATQAMPGKRLVLNPELPIVLTPMTINMQKNL
jgi:hypothetical protein